MNDGASIVEKASEIRQESDRLEQQIQGLEREVERLSQILVPVLSTPAPATVPGEDTSTTCEVGSICRGFSDRVKNAATNLADLTDRCQL